MSKLSVAGILRDHLGTLVNAETRRLNWIDISVQLGIPLAFGIAALFTPEPSQEYSGLAAVAMTIFASFFFGVFTALFGRQSNAGRAIVDRLLSETRANVAFGVLASLAAVALALLKVAGFPSNTPATPTIPSLKIVNGALAFLLASFFMTAFMAMKRLYRLSKQETRA